MARDPTLDGRSSVRPRARLYVDESRYDRWLYISVVAVREDERGPLFDALEADRHVVGYDRELHFCKITQHTKRDLALRWLARAMSPAQPTVRWHVLGIDLHTLSQSMFGKRDEQIYARFFRTAITYAIRALLPDDVIVTHLVHDDASIASHGYFDWHAPWAIRRDHGLGLAAERVTFASSDHVASGAPIDSTFIQLADVIVGATRLCLDASSKKAHQVTVATEWLPLVQRLCDDRLKRNPNSRFGHVDRCSLSFFPRFSLAGVSVEERELRSAFYTSRSPALVDQLNQQMSLFGRRPTA